MMRSFNALGFGLLALAGFGACSDGGNPEARAPGKAFELKTSALSSSFPTVLNVCYAARVVNQAGEEVTRFGTPNNDATPGGTVGGSATGDPLCSSQYGDPGNPGGGDIAYVSPCDASPGAANHNVTIWLDGVETTAGWLTDQSSTAGDTDFTNPCAFVLAGGASFNAGGCTLAFTCVENADVQVVFSVTILRDANQGFFDIAINFEDIFCSGKIDTCTPDNGNDLNAGGFDPDGADDPINLLWGQKNNSNALAGRTWTTVVALACTGGSNSTTEATATRLYTTDFNLTCSNGTDTKTGFLHVDGPEGNQPDAVGSSQPYADANAQDLVGSFAIYRGTELLDCFSDGDPDVGNCAKVYQNVAIALDDNGTTNPFNQNCTISLQATASGSQFGIPAAVNGYTTGINGAYPVIDGFAKVTGTAPAGAQGGTGTMQCMHAGVEESGLDDTRFNAHFTKKYPSGFGVADFCTEIKWNSSGTTIVSRDDANCIDDIDPID